MATLEERLAKMRADLKTMQSRTAGVQTPAPPTTTRTAGTGAGIPAAGRSGAKTGSVAASLDQRLARMRADLQTMKTASQIAARQEQDEVPGLRLPSLDEPTETPKGFGLQRTASGFGGSRAGATGGGRPAANVNAARLTAADRAKLRELEGQAQQAQQDLDRARASAVAPYILSMGHDSGGYAAVSEAQNRYDTLQQQAKSLRRQIGDAEDQVKANWYSSYFQAPDFDKGSKYKTTANGKKATLNPLSGTYTETGFDDILYDYINGNEDARGRQLVNDSSSNATILGIDKSFLDEMNEDEVSLFNYIYAKEGGGAAYEFINYLQKDLNYRQRVNREAWAAKQAEEHPIGSSAMSVLTGPLKTISNLSQTANMLANGEVDQNAGYNKYSYMNTAMRSRVSQLAEENFGPAGSGLYNLGMSMGDNLMRNVLAGGFGAAEAGIGGFSQGMALAIMGSGAAADATISGKDRGLTDQQAFTLGTVAGLAEIVTEKVSLETLLDRTGMERSAVGYIIKNVLAEGSEEVASDFINLAADVIVSQDKSEWQQAINAYMAQGMSEKDATARAIADKAVSMGGSFLMGGLSGGIMAGGAAGINAAAGAIDNARQNRLDTKADQGIDSAYTAMRDNGLFSPEAQRAVQDASTAVERARNNQGYEWTPQQGAQESQEGPSMPEAVPAQEQEETAPLPSQVGNQGQNETAPVSGTAELPRISMADFTDRDSSVWNNVDYNDSQTRNDIQQRVHQEMVEAGQVVQVSESTREKVAESYPDLRDRKKSERTGILKQTISQLKRDLRQFLNGLKGGSYEFEVNGNILEARLYETGVKEVMAKISQDKAGMLYETENIFQNARYLYSTQDYEGDPNIYRWNYFYTPVQIGGETVGVRIAVRDMAKTKESQIYNWGIKQGSALDDGGDGKTVSRTGVSSAEPTSDAALDGGGPGQNPNATDASSAVPEDSVPQSGGNVNTGRPAPGVRDLRGQDGGLRLRSLLGDEDVEFLDRLGKAAGVAINVVDADGQANGWYQDGQVYITTNAAREGENSLVRQVALHEVTHYMKDAAPEEYRRYTEKIAELQGEDLDRAVARVRDEYAAGGVTLNDEEAMDELAAHYTENLLEDRDLFRRLALEDRTLAQRVLDALRRFIERIKGVFTGRQSGQMEQIAEAWADALDQAGVNARQGGVEYSEGTRYSIRRTADGEQYVDVDVDQARFKGLSVSEMQTEAKKVILERFRNQVIGRDYKAYVNKSAAEHYAYPANRRMDITQKQDKMQAATELDHIMEVATFRENVPDDGRHPNATGGIDKLDVKFRVSGRMYDAEISVLVTDRGRLFYDLTKFRDTTGREIGQTQSAAETPSGVSTQSVAQTGEEVNPRRELTFQEEVQRQLTGEENPDHERENPQSPPAAEPAPFAKGAKGRAYSLQGTEGLGKELHELRRQNQRLEEAENDAPAPAMTDQEAKTEARRLLMEIGSQADLDETAGLLQALYNHMSETGAKPNDSATRQAAETIARNILDSASETDDAMWRDYESLRKYLKDTKIKVPRDAWGGLDVVGGYNEFRKQYFGRLNLSSTEGRSIDDVYSELSGEYPGLFDEDAHPNPEDQILQIAEVLDAIKPETFNPYAGDSAGAADWLAGEILERFYDRRTDRRVNEAVKSERKRGLDRQKKRLKQVRDQRDQKIKAIKEHNREMARKKTARMNTTQMKDAIYRHVNTLGQRLRYPSDKARIPEALRWPVINLLDSLDLQGRFGYVADEKGKIELPVGTDENGDVVKGRFRRVKVIDKNGNPVAPLNEDGSPYTGEVRQSSRTQAALELKAALEKLANSEEYELAIDPDLAEKLNEIAGMKNKTVAAMSAGEARTVWETVRAVEHAISNADKVLGQSKYKKLSDMAEAIRSENGDRKDRRNSAVGILDAADKLLNLDMLTAETFFHRLGKAGDDLYRQMREAQDKQIAITGEGVDFFQSALEESGQTVKDILRAERENHSFTVDGQKITISTAQLMDLYALFKREQAMDHITIGGLYFEGGRDGLYQTGQSKPVHVTVEDLGNMLNTLTPAQRGLVDRLQNYMSTTLSDYGNEATEAVYGYWKFKEKNYWPIKVHKTQLKTDPAQDVKAKTIPSFGMTRALTPNANNAVTVRSFLDSYTEHLNQMATYAGWLEASENITRLHNFKFTEEGKRTGETVKTLFKKVYGEGGDAYLDNLMQDIAQGTRTGDPAGLTSKLVRNFKVNAVAGNFRVILQQPTAILRAAEVINPVYMATPGNPLEAFEEAKKWAKIAQWKDWGYFEMGTGRSLRELMVGPEGAMDKFRNLAGTGAGFADNVGWGILWNAVKAETRAQHKELKTGSDAFYKQCAERFGEIIDRTQVVDSVLHRTQIMRSGDGLTQMATSFMSEPSKIYNMVARDVYDITHAEKGSPERKRAIRHVARTGIALTASYVVNAAAQAAVDAIRNDDRDKEYSEKFLEAYTGLDGTEETAKDVVLHLLGGNLGQNYLVFGYLPYVKDIQSIIQGYDVTRADMDGVSKFVAAAQSLEKALAGSGKKTALNAGLETAMKGLGLLGLPVDRLKRDLVGLGNTLLLGFGKNEAVYDMDKLMLDISNSNNASVFYDTLYRAMDGDWMEYQHIYGDMLKNGFTPGNINTAMEKRMAEEAGIAKDRMLPVKWAPPGEDEEFDAMVQADGSWLDQVDEDVLEAARQVSAAETEEVEKVEEEWHEKERQTDWDLVRTVADQPFNEDVKELTMENAMGKTAYAKYMAARDAGVSTYDYVNFLEDAKAANIARGKDGSSPSQDDVEKALNGSRLTAAQKRAIWEAQGWKKESPWR